MRLFGRSPGAVYRVYGEDEYLEGDTQPVDLDGRDDSLDDHPRPAVAAPHFSRLRLASFAGPRPAALLVVAMIVAVAVSAAVLVMNATTHHAAHAVAAGAQPSKTVSPRRGQHRSTLHPAQPPRTTRPRPKRALVHVVRSNAHTRVRVSAPAVLAPVASSYRSAGGASDNALSEFGFER
ncbi:MAG TPA: hypothetical protein VGY30_05665 [Solirubrobacteraceae bacterium]|jgi:hypothetical protein|nr:hypothetical protein [Solirubrobacteraceae bacterium]